MLNVFISALIIEIVKSKGLEDVLKQLLGPRLGLLLLEHRQNEQQLIGRGSNDGVEEGGFGAIGFVRGFEGELAGEGVCVEGVEFRWVHGAYPAFDGGVPVVFDGVIGASG